jgi:hypothetical protein
MIPQSAVTKQRLSFARGDRVQLHPATDRWMRGDRYGEVVLVGRKLISVKMDVSGQIAKLHPSNILTQSLKVGQ